MVILMRTTSYLMCKLKMSTLSFVMVALMRTTSVDQLHSEERPQALACLLLVQQAV